MIGAAVFVIFFVLFTLISLAVDLPPGIWLHDWFNITETEYASLINGIVNGAVYGVIIWLAFSLAKMALGRRKESVEAALLEEALEEASKFLIGLTEIRGIGPKRAEELKAAGVNIISDLATSSAKDLSQKTGISERIISRWIEQAKEMIE